MSTKPIAELGSIITPDSARDIFTDGELVELHYKGHYVYGALVSKMASSSGADSKMHVAEEIVRKLNSADELLAAMKLALEYWKHRQQRYKNRHPAWVEAADAAIAKVENNQ